MLYTYANKDIHTLGWTHIKILNTYFKISVSIVILINIMHHQRDTKMKKPPPMEYSYQKYHSLNAGPLSVAR